MLAGSGPSMVGEIARVGGCIVKTLSLGGRILGVFLAMTFAFSGVAIAAIEIPTSLTLHASDTSVHKGDTVTFSGRLRSKNKHCRAHQRITLFEGNEREGSTRTNGDGEYSFHKTIHRTRTW